MYQFQVSAMNIAGLGAPSAVSECFKCEEWTIAVPGKLGTVPFLQQAGMTWGAISMALTRQESACYAYLNVSR